MVTADSFAACDLQMDRIYNYEGDIAGRRIRLSISSDAGALAGVYVHATDLTDIVLAPRQTAADSMEIDQFDAGGDVVARFLGHFETRDPKGYFGASELQCEVMTGSWADIERSDEAQPFYLRLDSIAGGSLEQRYRVAGVLDDDIINDNAAKLWNALRENDRSAVAQLVAYPFSSLIEGQTIEIRTPEQLLAYYDHFFPAARIESVLREIPRHMGASWRGMQLGGVLLDSNGNVVLR
jgi:hypothetical protein